MKRPFAYFAGTGRGLPAHVMTNFDFGKIGIETSDEWIVERTGIRERRIASRDETTAVLAAAAGAAAIKDAGLEPDAIDLVVVATCTPDQQLPAVAAFVADALGMQCGTFDINAACAGWVYGAMTASGIIGSGGAERVLVIGAETLSRIVDPADRGTVILFGDGAGAAVLGRVDGASGVLAFDCGTDPSAIPALELRPDAEFVTMEGREVFRRAVRAASESCAAVLGRAGVAAGDVDLFIPHQANARIVDALLPRLGIAPERTFMNIERYGNTSGASIPIALAEARDAGRLHDGALVLLSGFGAGMTWASILLRWHQP